MKDANGEKMQRVKKHWIYWCQIHWCWSKGFKSWCKGERILDTSMLDAVKNSILDMMPGTLMLDTVLSFTALLQNIFAHTFLNNDPIFNLFASLESS